MSFAVNHQQKKAASCLSCVRLLALDWKLYFRAEVLVGLILAVYSCFESTSSCRRKINSQGTGFHGIVVSLGHGTEVLTESATLVVWECV